MKLIKPKSAKKYGTQIKTFDLVGDGEEYADYGYGLMRYNGGYVRGTEWVNFTYYEGGPTAPVYVAYSSILRSYFWSTDSKLYFIDLNRSSKFALLDEGLSRAAFCVEMFKDGRNVMVAFCNLKKYVFNGARIQIVEDTNNFYTGVMHCGRFFARDFDQPYKLVWAASHAFDWTEGINGCGYIYLDEVGGKIIRLLSFGDKLLAVRERGITVIRAYGEPQHYKVEPTASYLVADGIVERTCSICAGKLFFATPSGVYCFDGNGIEKVVNPDEKRISSPVNALGFGDKYYLVCTDAYLGKNKLFAYDATEKSGYFVNVELSALYTLDSFPCGVCGKYVCVLYRNEVITRGYWRSKELYFGSQSVKYLRRLYIDGDEDVETTVTGGGVTRKIVGNGWLTVNMSAVSFRISCGVFGKLTQVKAEVEVRNGV